MGLPAVVDGLGKFCDIFESTPLELFAPTISFAWQYHYRGGRLKTRLQPFARCGVMFMGLMTNTTVNVAGQTIMSIPPFDDELMMNLAAGNAGEQAGARAGVMERYSRSLQGAIQRCLTHYGYDKAQSAQYLDDIFQETVIEIYKAAVDGMLYSKTPLERLKYIFGIARNTARQSLRSMRRYRKRVVDDEERFKRAHQVLHASGITTDSTVIADAKECLGKLTGRERDVMIRRFSDLDEPPTYQEIAEELGIAEGAAKAYSSGGRQKLQDCMRKKGHGLTQGAQGRQP